MKNFHLLDYGVGNIGSLLGMIESLGLAASLTDRRAEILESPLLVLPGVGSAQTAMRRLEADGLLDPLRERHALGRPILGICLGAQLLFETLEESGSAGIGFLRGTVARLAGAAKFHTGWSRLDWDEFHGLGLTTALKPADSFFFNHQYVLPRASIPRSATVAGRPHIPALYLHEHLCGIQFHPEKSQAQGRLLLRNLIHRHYGL
ncbi:MAG TPA: imidazole glycerol phosphate synthase subunit HisH [Lacunisphaera sp.]|nr:imidazole glycerol phosphate synthase subunit HisH [Lacunisphaera sp.]